MYLFTNIDHLPAPDPQAGYERCSILCGGGFAHRRPAPRLYRVVIEGGRVLARLTCKIPFIPQLLLYMLGVQ